MAIISALISMPSLNSASAWWHPDGRQSWLTVFFLPNSPPPWDGQRRWGLQRGLTLCYRERLADLEDHPCGVGAAYWGR